MILVDTSVWVDHLRRGNAALARLLAEEQVLCHPLIVGELACGQFHPRADILGRLQMLPESAPVEHEEVLALVERQRLMGTGIGWIDAHLLASALLSGATLWTLDQACLRVAGKLSILARV